MKTACVHEIGARDSQQDAFGIAESGKRELFAAVADGMGGLVDSGQVSSLLITALKNACGTGGALPPARKLQLMFREAVEEIERFMEERTARSGSTLVACLVRDGALSWLSVGDSRIYLWRSGGLIQLNRDHDFHHELVMLALQGEMTLEEADSDGRRESLTSYIGGGFPRKAEWNEEPVRLLPGDKVLLVSDGVYRALSQDELASILENPAEEAAEEIKKRIQSKKLPRQDNFTAVVLEA